MVAPSWDVGKAAELWRDLTLTPAKIAEMVDVDVNTLYGYASAHRNTFPARSPAVPESYFTPAQDELIRKLWNEGASSRDIGAMINRSKNSVIGRVHRLNLPARPSPIIRDVPGSPPRKRATRVARPREYKLPPLPSVKLAPPPEIQHPIPRATKGDGCRMPLWGDDEPPTHKYCGAQTAWIGCSWCWSCLQRVAAPETYQRITHRLIAA